MKKALATLLFAFSFSAQAQSSQLNTTCEIKGTLRLEQNSQIYCNGNLVVSESATIITQGFELSILVDGLADLSAGLKIVAFDEPHDVSRFSKQDSGDISFSATTTIGKLTIDNQALTIHAASGNVSLDYISAFEYDHEIAQSGGGGVEFLLNGNKENLVGPLYKPAL